MTSRVSSRLGTAPLPASLSSNDVACCTEMTARIWAKTSPGVSRSSPTPKPGPDATVDELLHRGRPRPAGHVARWRQCHRGRRRSDRVEIGIAQMGAMGQRDVGPEQTAAPQLGYFAARRRRAGTGMDPLSLCAGLGPSGGDRVQFGLDDVGRGTGDRDVSGWRCARGRRDENRSHPGVGVGRQRRLEMCDVIGDVTPVDDGGDSRREGLEQPDQRGGVDVVRGEVRRTRWRRTRYRGCG